VPNAELIELGDLADRAIDLPTAPTTVMCGHGERAATAASLLERAGRTDVSILVGGPVDWATAAGLPLDTD
jgi:rhodanese-related sulfurtransferase